MDAKNLTRYERARIIGARALQIAMNAPLLIKITPEDLEKIKFDALKIAEVELDSGILPISVNAPLPQKKEGKLKRQKVKELSDKEKKKAEKKEEKDIIEDGDIMALTTPEDEAEEYSGDDGKEDYE